MTETLFDTMSKYITLDDHEKLIIGGLVNFKKLRKRQYLLQEGEVSKTENYVLKGCLRTYQINEKGQEHVMQFSVEDWWVGDMYSFLTETSSAYNIDCLEDCELLQFSKANLQKMYDLVPKTERYFRILVQNAYVAATQRLLSSISLPANERYAAFIDKYPEIEQRVPNHQIASYLGITPESLSRIRKQVSKR
jgi:CRP-like cAMP-binding protein